MKFKSRPVKIEVNEDEKNDNNENIELQTTDQSTKDVDGGGDAEVQQCATCGVVCATKADFVKHQDQCHPGETRSFCCSHCDKSFKELRTLKLHIKIHTAEYPEHCQVCKKSFRTKWQLKQHQMDHGGERPYPCPECQFTCKTKQQLNEHRRKHSGEKAYSCQQCGTRFTYRNGLIKHTKLNRCPKKIITPDGETIFKKRNRSSNSGSGGVGGKRAKHAPTQSSPLSKGKPPQHLHHEISTTPSQPAGTSDPPKPQNLLSQYLTTGISTSLSATTSTPVVSVSQITGLSDIQIRHLASILPPGSNVRITRHQPPASSTDFRPNPHDETDSLAQHPSGQLFSHQQFVDNQTSSSSVALPSYQEAFAPSQGLAGKSDHDLDNLDYDLCAADNQQYGNMLMTTPPTMFPSSGNFLVQPPRSSPEDYASSDSSALSSASPSFHHGQDLSVFSHGHHQEASPERSNQSKDVLDPQQFFQTMSENQDAFTTNMDEDGFHLDERDLNSIKTIVEQTFTDGRDMLDIISSV